MWERLKWGVWTRWPQWMPASIRTEVLASSEFSCEQLGQGSPLVVIRRDVFERGEYEPVRPAPSRIAGERWIIREWLRAHPGWRPCGPK